MDRPRSLLDTIQGRKKIPLVRMYDKPNNEIDQLRGMPRVLLMTLVSNIAMVPLICAFVFRGGTRPKLAFEGVTLYRRLHLGEKRVDARQEGLVDQIVRRPIPQTGEKLARIASDVLCPARI